MTTTFTVFFHPGDHTDLGALVFDALRTLYAHHTGGTLPVPAVLDVHAATLRLAVRAQADAPTNGQWEPLIAIPAYHDFPTTRDMADDVARAAKMMLDTFDPTIGDGDFVDAPGGAGRVRTVIGTVATIETARGALVRFPVVVLTKLMGPRAWFKARFAAV